MFSSGTHLNTNSNLQNLRQIENEVTEGASQSTKRKTRHCILQAKNRKKPKNQNALLQFPESFSCNITSTSVPPPPLLSSNAIHVQVPINKSTLEKMEDILQELLPLWVDRERECCSKLFEKVKLLHYSYWNNCNGVKASQFNSLNSDHSAMNTNVSSTTGSNVSEHSPVGLYQAINENSNSLLQSIFSNQIVSEISTPQEVQQGEMRIEKLSNELWSLFDEPSLKISADFFYDNLSDALECRHLLLFEKLCDKGRGFFVEQNDVSIFLQNEIFFSRLLKEDLPTVLIALKYIEDLSFLSCDTCALLYFYAIDAKIYAAKTGEFNENMAEELIDLLLQKKAMLNSFDAKNKMTPLLYAARHNLTLFKKIVNAGARLDVRDRYGNGLIYHALEAKQFHIVEYIRELILKKRSDGVELQCFNNDNDPSFFLLRNLVCRDCYEGVNLFLSFGPFNKEKLKDIFINNVLHFISDPKGRLCRLLLNHFGFKDAKEENEFVHFAIQSLLDKFIGKSFFINPKNVSSLNLPQKSRSVSSVNLSHSSAAAPMLSSAPSSAVLSALITSVSQPCMPIAIPLTALEKISQMNFNAPEQHTSLSAQSNNNLTKKRLITNFSSQFSSTAILFIEQGLTTLMAANVSLNIADSEGSTLFVKLFYHLILNRVDKEIVSKFVLWMLENGISPCSFDFQCHRGIVLKNKSEVLNAKGSEMENMNVEALKEHILFHFLELDNPRIMKSILSFATNLSMKNSKGYHLLEVAVRRVYDFAKNRKVHGLVIENDSKAREEESQKMMEEGCDGGNDSNDNRIELMELMFKRREIVKLLLPRFTAYEISSTMMSFISHPYEDDIKKLLEL